MCVCVVGGGGGRCIVSLDSVRTSDLGGTYRAEEIPPEQLQGGTDTCRLVQVGGFSCVCVRVCMGVGVGVYVGGCGRVYRLAFV